MKGWGGVGHQVWAWVCYAEVGESCRGRGGSYRSNNVSRHTHPLSITPVMSCDVM